MKHSAGQVYHTLSVKVVSTKMVLQRGSRSDPQACQMRIAECLDGNETGMIIFTARNEHAKSSAFVVSKYTHAGFIRLSTAC